ncbi:bifunctional hydroxymethylpyrimidine kinase/phosphomethylpyrimidine kinase [Sphingomonas sp. GlSt437]|uniref:bifunctional hydroxymethylpyrimidine kinase/phosphomethylpyrimidine kinase n=1 Tax=Sphingomonas sp. GlSt437 TaxID=3389970 RepID=UPI003A83C9D2
MTTPRILIIAGSDSGGGAGLQADIKTVTMLGGHAMTAVTAITAQNTVGVQAVMPVPAEMVVAQIRSVWSDIGVDAVKIGMLGSAETAHAVADVLEELSLASRFPDEGRGPASSAGQLDPGLRRGSGGSTAAAIPIVFDPVMVATSGAALADADTIAAFARLMAIATVTTPNLPELAALGGEAAVLAHGTALLVKGGHGEGDRLVDRLVDGSGEGRRWESERIATRHTHGTGCTLASAIATYLARGKPLPTAIARARQFVRLALRDAPGLGAGHGPMGQQSVRLDLGSEMRFNQATLPMADYAASAAFYRTLGLTEIVSTEDGHYARFEAPGGATLSIERDHGPATLYFECEDLDAEVARLRAAGIAFDSLPTDQSWLWREARLRDPAGNPLCLYQADENRRYPPWRLPGADA